ncbi:MAG: hypothetical protein ACK5UC_27020 [Planctomycetaceae bacterium]
MYRQIRSFALCLGLLPLLLSSARAQTLPPIVSRDEFEGVPPQSTGEASSWDQPSQEPLDWSAAPNGAPHAAISPAMPLFPAQSPADRTGPGHTVSLFNETSTLNLGGNVSLVGIAATERTFVPWNPLFVVPPSGFGYNTNTFEMHARQTNFQAVFTGPETGGFTPGAFLKLYMTNSSLTSDTYGLLPVVAFADVKNDDWRFAIGLQPDLFAPRDPVVIPISLMGGTGNSGTFRGQARVEHFVRPSDDFQTTFQFALSDPTTTILIDNNRRSTESNGWPNVEGRLALGFGPREEYPGGRQERSLELAAAGVVGQLRNSQLIATIEDVEDGTVIRSTIDVWGLSLDAKWNVTERFGFIGEGYLGQGLGNYAANIFQTFNSKTYSAVRGSGGFLEAFYYLHDRVVVHAGYGLDAPVRGDLAADGIALNDAWFSSLFWDVTKTVQLGFQADYRTTDFIALPDNDAMVFYTQFLWRF